MKKTIICALGALMFLGCGGGSSTSVNDQNTTDYTLGDKLIKVIATANSATLVDFDREKFYFTKYDDLTAFVKNLSQSVVCSKGNISISLVNQNIDKCGTYKIVANDCYISGTTLLFDGNATISTVNINNLGCYRTDVNYTSNVRIDKNILGKSVTVEYEKGFTRTYSPDANNSDEQYNIDSNGTLIADGDKYILNNYNVYIDNSAFTYNSGSIKDVDNNITLTFTDFSRESYLDPITYEMENSTGFYFIYQDNYYLLYNDSNGSTYILGMDGSRISNQYNYNEVYEILHK